MGDEQRTRRVPVLLIYLVGLAVLLGVVVTPLIEEEMMRAPLAEAILAVRRGDANGLRTCFTPEATLAYQDTTLPAAEVITDFAPLLQTSAWRGAARLGDYTHIRQRPDTLVEADFTVWVYLEGGDDLPYKRIPIQKQGHVTLKKLGWFRWKIQRITSDDADYGAIIQRHAPRDGE